MHKNAFTLAEVLLTLAIIGVVAALTIPAVITKVTQDQYVVGLKKAYNTLKAVEREAVQEHGPLENWAWTGNLVLTFETYFKPHFDILKDCGATSDDGCFASSYTLLNGSDFPLNLNGANIYKIITSDGISYAYSKLSSALPGAQGSFNIDVNGKKGPNIMGRDLFTIDAFPSSAGMKPRGTLNPDGLGSSFTSAEVDASCKTSGTGSYCPAKVLAEGAMNY